LTATAPDGPGVSYNREFQKEKYLMLDSIVEFLRGFEAKDWITFFASLAAFTMSLLSFRQKNAEGRQAIRKQLTEVLQKLSELNTEVAKFDSLADRAGYPANYARLLNDQRRVWARRASYLSQRGEDLVSPYEYLVIAGAFNSIDDVEQAEHFLRLASTDQKNSLDRGIALRGYARFQFSQHLLENGRTNYQAAIECFAGESDRMAASRRHI
jgi:hypothetical protein